MASAEVLRNNDTGRWHGERGLVDNRQDAKRMSLGEAMALRIRLERDSPHMGTWSVVLIETEPR